MYNNKETRAKVKAKLQRVIDKEYVKLVDIEYVKSLMYIFHFPKGENNIQMVYNCTKSGLNTALYAQWFALPTVDAMNRCVVAGSWLAGNDYKDMFLNFPLHPKLQKIVRHGFCPNCSRSCQRMKLKQFMGYG